MAQEPNGAVAAMLTEAVTGAHVVVEHRRENPAPRTTIELERNSRGYRWNITVAAEDPDAALATLARLEAELCTRYGSGDD